MSVKSRLKQRKTWFTLEQAAQRLSDEFSEQVTAENLLELALEGDLPISIQVYGAQKVMPIHRGVGADMVTVPSFSPVVGYEPGVTESGGKATAYVGTGIYQVGLNAASTKSHLHRLIGSEALGTVGAPAWYFIMENADGGEPYFYVPLEPVEKIKLLPLPAPETLLIKRRDVEALIAELVSEQGDIASGAEQLAEDLRALEALGLLAETVAKQAPKYQCNGKPNKAQIALAMSQQAGDVYGMSQSKLAHLLSDALDAWEGKRR